jgi:hypothetical protein
MRDRRRILGTIVTCGAAALATALTGGCDLVRGDWSSQASFTLDRDKVASGQYVEIRFDKLADEDGRLFWIAIVPEDTRNTDQTGRKPIGAGVRSLKLPTGPAGDYEVRVFTEDHGAPTTIVARRKLKVVP